MAAATNCGAGGCSFPVTASKPCPRHPRVSGWRKADAARPSSRERGYNARWDGFSRAYRKRHPLCAHHADGRARDDTRRAVPVAVVDHVTPLVEWPGGKFVESNLQPLCSSCHDMKTRRENGTVSCDHAHVRVVQGRGDCCEDCGRAA